MIDFSSSDHINILIVIFFQFLQKFFFGMYCHRAFGVVPGIFRQHDIDPVF